MRHSIASEGVRQSFREFEPLLLQAYRSNPRKRRASVLNDVGATKRSHNNVTYDKEAFINVALGDFATDSQSIIVASSFNGHSASLQIQSLQTSRCIE